tara:strand:+ start:763 stop:1182 length:420 start_codon:yes stop_codon:yes gene_type:complete
MKQSMVMPSEVFVGLAIAFIFAVFGGFSVVLYAFGVNAIAGFIMTLLLLLYVRTLLMLAKGSRTARTVYVTLSMLFMGLSTVLLILSIGEGAFISMSVCLLAMVVQLISIVSLYAEPANVWFDSRSDRRYQRRRFAHVI